MKRHLISTLAAALAVATSTAPAAASPSDPDAATDPGDPAAAPNQPPTARASFALAPRAERAGEAWSTGADNYRSSYVHPTSWDVSLDGCGSTGGTDRHGKAQAISFEWRLEPLDGQGSAVSASSTNCRATATVHSLGRWRAGLIVRAANGAVARADAGERRFRDLVIAAFGDSYTAGEGNPESRAHWTMGPYQKPHVDNAAGWSDRQCHRSRASWAMRAAQRFEDSSTAVTFLNYGCSGATTRDVVDGGYKGIEPVSGDERLPSQLAAARAVLGGQFDRGSRSVHTALMAMGVNDLGFSDILRECASFNGGYGFALELPGAGPIVDEPCTTAGLDRWMKNGLWQLEESYDRLEVGIAANLNARSVRFVEYPARIMTNGRDHHEGCGVLNGISTGEARWITSGGDDLNAAMAAAARRNGWGYVSGVRDAFRHHGYCADDSWFRSFSGSMKLQGNKFGTAHPLGAGHAAAGEVVAPTIPSEEQPLSPPARVRIEFERLRVFTPASEVYEEQGKAPLTDPAFSVMWHGWHTTKVTGPQYENRSWVAIPESDRTTIVDTRGDTIGLEGAVTLPSLKIVEGTASDERRGKGFRVTGPRRVKFFVTHRRADGWRPGEHTINGDSENAAYQLVYRVTVMRPPATGPTSATSG
ncbi:MAG TPA: GDSL-type esterase/lipase family protein [Thermoleophilaceae bacterium]|nr:GDSL-type esterase/lipase family protein [Thermoleophilaceae bacterium]